MKTALIALALVLALLVATPVLAGGFYAVPVRGAIVHSYWPVGPVYAYPMAPVAPAWAPTPMMYPPPAVIAPRVVVHPKVYVLGQPVRNAIRAVTP